MALWFIAASKAQVAQLPCVPLVTCGGGKSGSGGGSLFNPFTALNAGFKRLLIQFLTALQNLLANPVFPTAGPLLSNLYASAYNVIYLAPELFSILLVLALFLPRLRLNLLQAVLMAIIIGVIGYGSITGWDFFIGLRHDWVKLLMSDKVFGVNTRLDSGLDALQGLWIIVAAPLVIYYCVYLLVALAIQTIGIIIIKMATPVALLLYPYGERGKNLLGWTLGAGLACTLVCPVFAAITIQITKLAINGLAKGSLLELIFLVAGLRIAAKSQKGVYQGVKRAVATRVVNSLRGNMGIKGETDARIQEELSVNVRKSAPVAQAATMVKTEEAPSRGKLLAERVSDSGLLVLSGIVVKKVATSTNPYGKAAAVVAEGVQRTAKVRTEQRARRKGR